MAQFPDYNMDYVSDLKEKLPTFVQQHKPNRLVVTLYAESEGYSLSIRIEDVAENVIISCPYDDHEILNHIDKGEVMPMVQDLFREFPHNLFYFNCIIGEIRDCRCSNTYEPRYVLLKPTDESDFQDFEGRQRKKIKSTHVSEFDNPVFDQSLFPSSQIDIANGSLLHSLSTPMNCFDLSSCLRSSYKKHLFSDTSNLKRKQENDMARHITSESDVSSSRLFKRNYVELSKNISHRIDVKEKYASKPLWAVSNSDVSQKVEAYWDCYVQNALHKSYVMELLPKDYPENKNAVQSAEVSIMKIPGEEQYYGKLSIKSPLERDSSSSEFLLGSRMRVDKFIKKYTDVFTVEDTKPVKKQQNENGIITVTHTKAVKKILSKKSGENGTEEKSKCHSRELSFNINNILSKSESACNGFDAIGTQNISDTTKLLQSLSSSMFY